MAFNFGGAPAPGPPPAGGFGFGSSAPQPAAAPASFGFGGNASTSNTPAAPAGGFSFGGGGGGAPQPAATSGFGGTNAPAPTNNVAGTPAPSFTFGSTASNTPAPGTFGAPAPPAAAAPGGFSLSGTPAPTPGAFGFGGGNNNNAAPAPAGGGLSFGSTPAPGPGTSAFGGGGSTPAPGNAGSTTAPQGLEVPDMSDVFPNEELFSEITALIAASASPTEDGEEAASKLIDLLKCDNSNDTAMGQLLSSPKPLTYTGPDQNIRHHLQTSQNPSVILPGQREATLLPQMLTEVLKIADDLRISEKEALCLYAEVSNDSRRASLEAQLDESIIDMALSTDSTKALPPVSLGTNVVKAAKELYFFERSRLSRSILLLAQSRIQAVDQPWGGLIIEATDSLLQNKLIDNLMTVIREWTLIIGRIEQQLALGVSSGSNSFSAFTKEKQKKKHFDSVHLQFAIQERQAAAEALFYFAYNTQFKAAEVAGLIDVIKDLSNGIESDKGLSLLDPFHDVPSSYENPPHLDQPWAAPYPANTAPLKELKYLAWEKELVKKTHQTSMPDLLRCVSALVMTVITALDTKQTLIDRDSHCENTFGEGNMLCPPGETSTAGLEPIHQRLTFEGCQEWKRTDICGLLSASYAMLLASSPPLLSSPRAGSSSPSRARMRVFSDCITAPMVLKSVTFARLCLLPALQRPSRLSNSTCDSSEFFLASLAEYVANFLDTLSASKSLPVSRASWKVEQEQGLELERENQMQRREFRLWSGNREESPEAQVPTSVDLLRRPDCMDDVAALAIAVASLGSDYALKFWSTSRENDSFKLVPSRALKKLKALALEDESLPPFYLAFLAALALASNPSLAESGASVVFSLLSTEDGSAPGSWRMALETLRWYFRQFDKTGTSSTTSAGSSIPPSDNYYYQTLVQQQQQTPTKSAKSSKPLELGESNTFYLLSILGVIENVASMSAESRLQILSMKLPITADGNSGAVLGDSTLNIMFALLTAPLPPEVRGAALNAIAKLLSMDGMKEEDKVKLREFAGNAWELVESCQILPVMLLDQYPLMAAPLNRNTSGLRFPASSTSLVSSFVAFWHTDTGCIVPLAPHTVSNLCCCYIVRKAGSEATNQSLIPVDQRYAILYEMEHVESSLGRYTSTEGFLRLLSALFSCCCPPDLGKPWRIRTGCSPYVEYVVHYVLPRATGSSAKLGKLPFRTKSDQARLVALSLQVIESVLVRYQFPVHIEKHWGNIDTHAYQLLGQRTLAEKLVENDSESRTGDQEDFENKSIPTQEQTAGLQNPNNVHVPGPRQGPLPSSIPKAKSPGFLVLSNILSQTNGEILMGILSVLADLVPTLSTAGNECSDLAETYALFKEIPPTLLSAKHAGKNDNVPASIREKLLEALRPGFQVPLSFSAALSWQERSIMHALQILCATAVREEVFSASVTAASNQLRVVPVVRFDKPVVAATEIVVQRVHVARLVDLLSASRDIIPSVVDCIGYFGSADYYDTGIAGSGLSLVYFIYRALPVRSGIDVIFGSSYSGQQGIYVAIARRLLRCFERCSSSPDSQMLSLILSWLLLDLRKGKESTGLAHLLMLGMPRTSSLNRRYTPPRGSQDCFDVILNMLDNMPFVVSSQTSFFSEQCFEILTRLCDLKSVNDKLSLDRVFFAMEKLRRASFWRTKLEYFSSWSDSTLLESENVHVIHSIAWLLKGVATELHVLSGFSPLVGGLAGSSSIGHVAPQIGECQSLLTALFGANDDVVGNILAHLPLQRMVIDETAQAPPQDAMRAAMKSLDGSPEITEGYTVVDEKLLMSKLSQLSNKEDYERWAVWWNSSVKLDCAVSHVSEVVHVVMGASLSCFDAVAEVPVGLLLNLLTLILGRVEGISGVSDFSATATRNLAWIALLLSQTVSAVANESREGMDDLKRIRDQLARSIVVSGEQTRGVEAQRHQERTAMLGAGLIEVMKVLPHDETSWDHVLILDVAITLAKLSAVVEDNNHRSFRGLVLAKPTHAAMIARSCLVSLIEIWDSDAPINAPEESLAHSFLSKVPMEGREISAMPLLRLVGMLDVGIVTLIEQLLQIPFVGNLLIDSGLFQELVIAADRYMQEEHRLMSSGQKVSVGFPTTFRKHLQVFRVLMATSPLLSEAHVRALPGKFFEVLERYKRVLSRSFEHPGSNDKELCLLIQCIAQVSFLRIPGDTQTTHNALLPLGAQRVRGSVCEASILDLTLQIAVNPFPEAWCTGLPPSFKSIGETLSSDLVPITVSDGGAWWSDVFNKASRKSATYNFEEWTEEMFNHAILGANILEPGLFLVSTTNIRDLRFEMTLVRGLFRLAKAAEMVHDCVEQLYQLPHHQSGMMETETIGRGTLEPDVRLEFLRKLGPKLGSCTHKLLLALVKRVKILKQEPENGWSGAGLWSEYFKAICDVLDYTELESRGIPCLLHNTKEMASGIILAETLRKLIMN